MTTIATAFLVLLSAAAWARDPFVSPYDVLESARPLPETLVESVPYSVNIERKCASKRERAALDAAEKAYPPRDEVLRAIKTAHFKLAAEPLDEKLWWSSSFDGIRLPYAITSDAVRYYLSTSRQFREGNGEFKMDRTTFSYRATVTHEDTFESGGQKFKNVFVVRMHLEWSGHCGRRCALGFQKDRIVVMDDNNQVLMISGDGNTHSVVS